jgi:hypothetical protein
LKEKRNLVSCYREAGREVVAAGLGIYVYDRPQAHFNKPTKEIEDVLICHLSGGISQKFLDPAWTLGNDRATFAQVFPLLIHLYPDNEQARKAKFAELFKAATACVRECKIAIDAVALALEENLEMGRGELRHLARSFFEEPPGRGDSCFGCGGGDYE